MMVKSEDDDAPEVTIIGAGIVGICCALSLLERGAKVTVLDKLQPAEATSYGNAGVISPWSCVPQSLPGLWRSVPGWLLDPNGPVSINWAHLPRFLPWAFRFFRAGSNLKKASAIADAMHALNRPNVDMYQRHLSGTGEEDLVQASWYLHVYRKTNAVNLNDIGQALRIQREAPVTLVNGGELREVEPALSKDFKSGLLIKDQARALQPGALGKALAEKAVRMGAEFRQCEVKRIGLTGEGRWQVDLSDGHTTTDNLVIAAGPWSMTLLQPLGISLPLAAERGYHLEFHKPGLSIKHSIMDADRKFVCSSMLNGIRSAGTAEFANLDAPPNYARARMLKGLTKDLLPDLNTEDTEEWMGTRPSFPDSLPCICEFRGYRNLFAAFGHSHYGLGMAPKTGQIVSDLVMRTPSNVDISAYDAGRFS